MLHMKTCGVNQTQLFDVQGSIPHFSLAKSVNKHWKDVGSWLKGRPSSPITDRQPTSDPTIFYSAKKGVFKQHVSTLVHVERRDEL